MRAGICWQVDDDAIAEEADSGIRHLLCAVSPGGADTEAREVGHTEGGAEMVDSPSHRPVAVALVSNRERWFRGLQLAHVLQ